MIITLQTPLPRGKYKGKSIIEIAPKVLVGDWDYISWILNNWDDDFSKDVLFRHGWEAHCKETKFGSRVGITNDNCFDNLI